MTPTGYGNQLYEKNLDNPLFFIIFVLMTLTSKAFIGLEILCGVGLYGYLTANIFIHVFRKHLPNELEEDAIANGIDNPEIQ